MTDRAAMDAITAVLENEDMVMRRLRDDVKLVDDVDSEDDNGEYVSFGTKQDEADWPLEVSYSHESGGAQTTVRATTKRSSETQVSTGDY
jgi:IMP cyclohydrolase